MAIVSSEILSRTDSVVEQHTASDGRIYTHVYFPPDGADVPALMAEYATRLTEELRQSELNHAVLGEAWDYVLVHADNAALATHVRSLYRRSSRETLARVAARVLEWISNGRFTDAQVRNVFNLNVTQWNALKTKMQNLVAHHQAVEAAEGE